jgi:hypothetical protein
VVSQCNEEITLEVKSPYPLGLDADLPSSRKVSEHQEKRNSKKEQQMKMSGSPILLAWRKGTLAGNSVCK